MSTIVSPPVSLTFRPLRFQTFTWTLTDKNGSPISGATVTSTLYSDKNVQNPTQFPGTAVTGFTALPMPETPPGSGNYVGTIGASFNPPPATIGFIVTITAVDSGNIPLGSWDVPAIIPPPQDDIDLVELDDVKQWLGIPQANTDCDNVIQMLISGFSRLVINKTGRTSFKNIEQFIETYDGNGRERMFLNNFPIVNVASVVIGSYSVPVSTNTTSSGYFIEQSGRSIAFRSSGQALMPPQSIFPYMFTPGIGNVVVTYSAGYTSVPFDLAEACIKVIAVNYKRRDWIDLASKQLGAQGASGATVYRAWTMPPECAYVFDLYSRYARP